MTRPTDMRNFVAWNDEMVARYDPDAYHTKSPLPVWLVERLRVRAVVRMLGVAPTGRVLDVGCGAGNLLESVHAFRIGVDLSTPLLRKARGRLGDGAHLVRCDAAHLPFADASFDRVYCSEVLEHVLEPEAVVGEMRRVLREGGWAVVSVPNEPLINRVKAMAFRLPFARRMLSNHRGYRVSERMDDEWHLHEFDPDRLAEAVQGRFEITELRGVPFSMLPLRHVALLKPL